jgi:hypothetical protein
MSANLHQDLAKSRGRAARHVVLRFPRGKIRTMPGVFALKEATSGGRTSNVRPLSIPLSSRAPPSSPVPPIPSVSL